MLVRLAAVGFFVFAGLAFCGIIDWATGWAWASWGVAALVFEPLVPGLLSSARRPR